MAKLGVTHDTGTRFKHPNAIRFLAEELETLERDHYADGYPTDCRECRYAYDLKREMQSLIRQKVREQK